MVSAKKLKEYRELRGLSTRDVAAYCDISQPLIVQIENGEKSVTEYNYREIAKGINDAYKAKKNNTFQKPKVIHGRYVKDEDTEFPEATLPEPPKKKTRKKKEKVVNDGNA